VAIPAAVSESIRSGAYQTYLTSLALFALNPLDPRPAYEAFTLARTFGFSVVADKLAEKTAQRTVQSNATCRIKENKLRGAAVD
jgi:hypothetical protein